MLASDASHYYANFQRHAPFVLMVDAVATLRSYDRMMEIAGSVDRIIPGHDPKVRTYFPTCEYAAIELTALHEPAKAEIRELTMARAEASSCKK